MESRALKPGKVDVSYDKESDVLYISADKPKGADGNVEPLEWIVIRTRKGQLVGMMTIGLMSHLPSNRSG